MHEYRHTFVMLYLLLTHGKSGYANAPEYYVIRTCTLPVLFVPVSLMPSY